jgi:hypothetical protein
MLRTLLALAAVLPMLMPAGMCLCEWRFHVEPSPCCDDCDAEAGACVADDSSDTGDECECTFRNLERARVAVAVAPADLAPALLAAPWGRIAVEGPDGRDVEPPPSLSRGDPPRYIAFRTLLI